ncbi:hypothetical protein [Limnobacter litoralis]|uniref:Uncharacterized protein n=1 Tax=Limnobacter litoralis TaxID=481366 RepID=A0ABQ5YMJ5_9BURK|nr:hypothetical protein [Limnobacter litoralis]GLR25030.1 hypothetical protein GCM10007875_01170 [Limnobacter litoralis]
MSELSPSLALGFAKSAYKAAEFSQIELERYLLKHEAQIDTQSLVRLNGTASL